MRQAHKIVAVLASDIHSSQSAPIARCTEDWYQAMARPFGQVRALCAQHRCPFIIPGDLNHRWQSPPELINFLINEYRTMPHGVYALPGQHDLAYHNYNDIRRTAYWTLCEAKAIVDLQPGLRHIIHGTSYYAFPWRQPVKFPGRSISANHYKMHLVPDVPETAINTLNIALVHAYIWQKGCGYPGAPDDAQLDSWAGRLAGFDVAFFGDNHKGFRATAGKCKVVNCGTFMRRNADEIDYRPHVYLLRSDGQVKSVALDCSKDEISADHLLDDATAADLSQFLDSLRTAEQTTLDYPLAIRQYIAQHDTPQPVANLLLESLDAIPAR